MTYRIRFFEEAAAEIEHQRAWYRRRSLEVESSFLDEIDRAIALVLEAPERWPSHLGETRRYVLHTFPFSLVYFVEDDLIVVVAVASERMRPGYWRYRLAKRSDTKT
jgi:plasmid stabilization system protein ParE